MFKISSQSSCHHHHQHAHNIGHTALLLCSSSCAVSFLGHFRFVAAWLHGSSRDRHLSSTTVGSLVWPEMSPQIRCSATTRTYHQFLSNSGVCVRVDEGALYLPQFASKQSRVLLDAEDRCRKNFCMSTVAFIRCTLGPHGLVTGYVTNLSSVVWTTTTRHWPVFHNTFFGGSSQWWMQLLD